ncbi:hypothetical protein QUW63_06615 [Pseudoflavonifractor phocaeensis]|uniref:hypothetical protein n=1 Tax=Pseudoflavonifractor phocaeensis TaxID=1870988 RepID=UPI0025A4AEEA|nr:hypothetical protein [Pseudoflavonifractor phocaeensis]MDM8238776.1 hypothetical protein [Pseudoflavonifractor phocaeensis]
MIEGQHLVLKDIVGQLGAHLLDAVLCQISALIKDIKNVGAREALPRQISVGLLIGAAIGAGGTFAARKISARIKTHRELRDKELEEKLKTVLSDDDDPDKPEMEEPPC